MIDPVDLFGPGDRRFQDSDHDRLDGLSDDGLGNEPEDWPRPTETADRDPALDHHSLNAVADLAEAMAVQQRRNSRSLPRIDHGPKLELLPDPELLAAWEQKQAARWRKPAGDTSAQFSGASPGASPGPIPSWTDPLSPPSTEVSSTSEQSDPKSALAEVSVANLTGEAVISDLSDLLASSPATSSPATSSPATSDPATSDPATSDPATSDPATSEASSPATSDPVASEASSLATSDPVASSPVASSPAASSPAASDPATSNPATSDPTADDAPPRWGRMVLRLPADLAGGGLAWAQVWQQLMHRLHDGDRPWQAQAGVTLEAIDHGLEGRQMQAIAEALAESQLVLDRVITHDPTTAAAAIASALSLDYQPGDPAGDRAASRAASRAAADPGDCLYLDQPVRSGVEIRYPGSVVVRGDVNPGGAIAAGGDVLVWGRLRGLAHAGIQGNARAVILALHLDAPQVRIAQRAARVPDSALESPIPEVAYISGTSIRISPAADFAKIEFEERIR